MTEWIKAKVKRYTAGATWVLLEGHEVKDGKPVGLPVNEPIQKQVRNAGWGAEIEYQEGTWSDSKGNVKGMTLVKVLKAGPKLSKSNGKTKEERLEIIRMNCLRQSMDFIKLNMGTFTDKEGKVEMAQVLRQAEVFKSYVVEGEIPTG